MVFHAIRRVNHFRSAAGVPDCSGIDLAVPAAEKNQTLYSPHQF
jgi:hypothetical protein